MKVRSRQIVNDLLDVSAPLGVGPLLEDPGDVALERLPIGQIERRHLVGNLPVEIGLAQDAFGDLLSRP